jgi:hypothetical protein
MTDEKSDDEIAATLAEKMGWSWAGLLPRIGVELFQPAVVWDHIGLCLWWAQKEFGEFETGIGWSEGLHYRWSQFRERPFTISRSIEAAWAYIDPDLGLTPRHIARAIMKAVEDE